MLPNVKVNVTEDVSVNVNSLNTFIPLVILKTKTGPIGTELFVATERVFNDVFGKPDNDTPEAFGLVQYIKNYGGAYVVRAASSSATEGEATIKVGEGSSAVELISIKTVYKTDALNGTDVKLIQDTTNNKLYLSAVLENKTVTSIKETLNYTTATADLIEAALNKVVASFNEAQNKLVLENLFTDKTEEDTKPAAFTELTGTVTGGISGNTSIDDNVVTAIAEKFRGSDLGFDAIVAPGFESATVVNKLASVAADSSFIAIASISGESASAIAAVASTYTANASLALYADKVYLLENTTIQVPACIAVLPAYITRDESSKWLAPAGVTRGTLSLVAGLVHNFGDSDLEDLYTNNIPVNGIKRISGRGYVVWGQKTASQDTVDYQDRINVVRLVKYCTKEIDRISYDYLFEPITSYTFNAWTLRVESLLEEIKNGSGLDDYRVIMDETINTEETIRQNKLIGIVRVRPLEAAEFIEINFVITDDVEGGNA